VTVLRFHTSKVAQWSEGTNAKGLKGTKSHQDDICDRLLLVQA
jgi:hypothetical protein